MSAPDPMALYSMIWDELMTMREMGRALGVHHSTVHYWCRRDGVPRPTSSEMKRVKALERSVCIRTVGRDYLDARERELERCLARLKRRHRCARFLNDHPSGTCSDAGKGARAHG